MRTVRLTVPPGAVPGEDSLTFVLGGDELDVPVPAGSKPGDVLELQVGGDGDGEEEGDDRGDGDGVDGTASGRGDGTNRGGDGEGGKEEGRSGTTTTVPLRPAGPEGECAVELSLLESVPDTDCDDTEHSSSGAGKDPTKSSTEAPPPAKRSKVDGDAGGDGTHAMVWPAGRHMCRYLASPSGMDMLRRLLFDDDDNNDGASVDGSAPSKGTKKRIRTKRALELGSGLGACGLALARTLADISSTASASSSAGVGGGGTDDRRRWEVVLTDRGQGAVELLRRNAERNRGVVIAAGCNHDSSRLPPVDVSVEELTWGRTPSEPNDASQRFDVILGSDLLYDTQTSYEPLIETIVSNLRPGGSGIILLSVRWRKPKEERTFFCLMRDRGYEFTLVKPNEDRIDADGECCHCPLNWDEYGDPASAASASYFRRTTARAAGEAVPLAEVTEDHMGRMTDDEYDDFEARQIQIYLGRRRTVHCER